MNWSFVLLFALRKRVLNRNLFVDYASKHKLVTSTMNHTYVLATSSSVIVLHITSVFVLFTWEVRLIRYTTIH